LKSIYSTFRLDFSHIQEYYSLLMMTKIKMFTVTVLHLIKILIELSGSNFKNTNRPSWTFQLHFLSLLFKYELYHVFWQSNNRCILKLCLQLVILFSSLKTECHSNMRIRHFSKKQEDKKQAEGDLIRWWLYERHCVGCNWL
jgi:hypothetical protein